MGSLGVTEGHLVLEETGKGVEFSLLPRPVFLPVLLAHGNPFHSLLLGPRHPAQASPSLGLAQTRSPTRHV